MDAPIQPAQKDDDAGLLDEQDMAPPDEPRRDREQRLLAKAARQAQAPKPAPTPPPAFAAPSVVARKLLAQPVGGPRRLLLDTALVETSRTAMAQAVESLNTDTGQPKPVLLKSKLPAKNGETLKAGREASVLSLALAFIEWLQNGLVSRELTYNETGAAVHFVEHGMALVSPLIFKLFAATQQVDETEIADHAMQVQSEVIKARWHVIGPGKRNILRYQVLGCDNMPIGSGLSAVVLTEPGRFVQPVPSANPVLRLDSGDSMRDEDATS